MGNPGSGSGLEKAPERKGSVQRARQMLEAGKRPRVQEPEPSKDRRDVRSISSKASHMTQWPLPDTSTMPGNFLDPQASFIPRGPPPRRPPRPDAPSLSIYSERSAPGFAPSLLHFRQPRQSFSQPLPYQNPSRIPLRDTPSPSGRSTPHGSLFNEDLSDTDSVSSIPNYPPPPQQGRTAGVVPPPPNSVRHTSGRRSSVSPIPEELTDSPTNVDDSYASSRAVPSDYGSPTHESEILGTYLDDESDDFQEAKKPVEENGEGLVRSASVGTRGKPSLRVIRKPSAESPAPSEGQPRALEANTIGRALSGTPADEELRAPVPSPKKSYSSLSDRSYEFDLEKGAFVLDIGQPHPEFQHDPGNQPGLPRAAPTMSNKRPGAHRPPRLDMDAVRDAQARGSLTSLPDLIRRATKLASHLDHGRTASRSDNLSSSNDSRSLPWNRQRNSGSLQDTLENFPPPPRRNTEGYSSWPMFLRRSTLHNIETLNSHSDHGEAKEKPAKRSRRCCGMPLWLFILICVAVIIIITLAVLLPVFLVAVPKERANNESTCEASHPCKNGGVSVSSGSVCSCVCTNGYTGSQCTIAGDSSCTTTDIDGSSTSKTATMGSDLPQLFQDSRETFNIRLDPVTIMALFSKSNVSCTTQNELVSINDVSSKTRRFFPVQLDDLPSQTLAARDTVATMKGIVFDDSSPTAESLPTATDIMTASPPPQETSTTSSSETSTTSAPTTTAQTTTPTTSPTSTSTSKPTSTATSVPQKALTFSQVAILYIFEMTGTLNAAIQSEEDIRHYLKSTYSTSNGGNYDVDLSRSGVQANFALDFDEWTITMGNGTKAGG
ncbi:hypothetical protein SI65_06324 [Aspergillus cristatus]|uniref:EGF-like domain-containing protein n=1 Tax=Aspergillus cristatus TaxID=573508 RepID=A0A1E3BBV6_ASPCR|nr:hypothetical protein SI65_06324 [Aspergillus cristatus]